MLEVVMSREVSIVYKKVGHTMVIWLEHADNNDYCVAKWVATARGQENVVTIVGIIRINNSVAAATRISFRHNYQLSNVYRGCIPYFGALNYENFKLLFFRKHYKIYRPLFIKRALWLAGRLFCQIFFTDF